MRRTFRTLALFVGLVSALPAAALTITASDQVFFPVSRFEGANANSLDDSTIDAFEILSVSTVSLRGFSGRSVGPSRPQLVGRGQIQIIGGRLEWSHARFGRRDFVWVGGAPTQEAPIPEPGAALLFGVGTLLVGWRLRGRR